MQAFHKPEAGQASRARRRGAERQPGEVQKCCGHFALLGAPAPGPSGSRSLALQADQKAERQLHKVARYLKGTIDLATFVPKAGGIDEIVGYVDGDWGCDDHDRKSVSGGFVMVGGARLHSHSRTTAQHALSSGESEVMALSELLKETKLLQYNLEFAGCGLLPIALTPTPVWRGTSCTGAVWAR